MKEKKLKFIRVLLTELYDLGEDIDQLIALDKSRCEKGQISNYVCMENDALFRNEIACLKDFEEYVKAVEMDRFQTLEELASFLEDAFRKRRAEGNFLPALEGVVSRKMRKALDYVKS